MESANIWFTPFLPNELHNQYYQRVTKDTLIDAKVLSETYINHFPQFVDVHILNPSSALLITF